MVKKFNLNEQCSQVIQEIMAYKWIESEKLGSDIGNSRAAKEWIDKHYDSWFKSNCKKFTK